MSNRDDPGKGHFTEGPKPVIIPLGQAPVTLISLGPKLRITWAQGEPNGSWLKPVWVTLSEGKNRILTQKCFGGTNLHSLFPAAVYYQLRKEIQMTLVLSSGGYVELTPTVKNYVFGQNHNLESEH